MQRAAMQRAVADVTPIVVGYLPFALLMGTSAVASGVDPLVGWMVSPVVFAGAAQLVLYRLVEAGAPALVVVASVLAVNARLLVYGMAVAPAFAEFPRRWRLVGPFLLTDPMFALASVYFEAVEDPRCRRWYYATTGLIFWVMWTAATAVGMVAGSAIPASVPLDFAVPLSFLPMLAGMARGRAQLAAAGCGAAAAVAASGLPFGLGLLAGCVAGMLAGMVAEGRHG